MTELLIRRLEQVRAHLDAEHKHLVDEVYAALAPADPTLGTGDIPPLSGNDPQEASTWHPGDWTVCDNEDGS